MTFPRSLFRSGAAAVSFVAFDVVLDLPPLALAAAPCLVALTESLLVFSPLGFLSEEFAEGSLSPRCRSFFACTFSCFDSLSDRLCLDLDPLPSFNLLAFLSLMNCTSGVVITACFFLSSPSGVESTATGLVMGWVRLSKKAMKSES